MSNLHLNPNITPYTRQQSRVTPDDIREQYGLDKVYQLSQNENPLGPSPKVVEAISAVAPTLSYYPDYSDIELRQAIVDALGRDGITPDHIYTGCSGFESLELMARGFLQAGDEVLVSSPTFTGAYKKIAEPLGATVVDVPLVPDTWGKYFTTKSLKYPHQYHLHQVWRGTLPIGLRGQHTPSDPVEPPYTDDTQGY